MIKTESDVQSQANGGWAVISVLLMLPLQLIGRFAALLAVTQSTTAFQSPRRSGQEPVLTVERAMEGELNDSGSPDIGPWRPDGKSVLVQRPSGLIPGGTDLVIVEEGAKQSYSIVVPASSLIPAGEKAPIPMEQFKLSEDGRHLLIFNNSKRVWRQNTIGDYWALNVSSGKLMKLGGNAPPSSMMFAKISPDGTHVAYVLKNNLYSQDLETGVITPLTTDGSDKVINGTSDWVYEEELDIRDGWRWSPDSKSIAYWQIDSSPEPVYSMIDDTSDRSPRIIQFPFPQTGQTNPDVRVGVVPVTGGPTTWIKDVATNETGYIVRLTWVPNSQNLLLEHLNRLQNENRYLVANSANGEVREVFVDRDATWVDVLDTGENGVRWVDGGKSFLALSERDGWRHIYSVSVADSAAKLLTPEPFDVEDVTGVDEQSGRVYFSASPSDSTQRYLYSTWFRGKAESQRLTPPDSVGTNRYDISPDGKLAFHSVSRLSEPTISELIRLPSHEAIRRLIDNSEVKARASRLNIGTSKFVKLDAADGSKMDASLIFPPGFDPKKRYPVVFNVYGEPAGAIVQDSWDGGRLFDRLLAQNGYIVAAVDNRGTPALKGRAWRKSVYRKIGVIASEDQAAAVRQLDKLPYVDSKRIAIWGWSGGGTMTLNMLFRYPDLYRLGMSVAPVPDMHLYDTIYQERYMGLPKDNEADYVNGSPITFANRLRGSLLIVHGSGDDNVHYQGTERLVNELVADDKAFQLMVYPNRTHAISEGPGTRLHLYKLLFRFLTTNMPAGER